MSKGIPQADIDALPVAQYYEVAGTTSGEEEQCPICRQALLLCCVQACLAGLLLTLVISCCCRCRGHMLGSDFVAVAASTGYG